jgi:acyl carrier protein
VTQIPLPETAPNRSQAILSAVFQALDDVNELLAPENQLVKSLDTVLGGPDAILDSMGFVNLIAAVEERVEETVGAAIRLTDSDASIDTRTFRTVATLYEYIAGVLAPELHGSGGNRRV